MIERKGIVTYHPDGEIPGKSVVFGGRLDDEKTQGEIEERNLGLVSELPNGDGRQLIVSRHVPLQVKLGVGAVMLATGMGVVIYGSYRVVKWVSRMREKEHWESKKEQNPPTTEK